jgi:hypothetical protein
LEALPDRFERFLVGALPGSYRLGELGARESLVLERVL